MVHFHEILNNPWRYRIDTSIFFVYRCEKLILWYIYSRGENLEDCSVKYSLHSGVMQFAKIAYTLFLLFLLPYPIVPNSLLVR